MKLAEAMKTVLKVNGRSQVWLAETLGYRSQSAISQMFLRGNINLNTLCAIMEVLDYEVTIQPRKTTPGARPNGQIVLESGTDGLTIIGRYDPRWKHPKKTD